MKVFITGKLPGNIEKNLRGKGYTVSVYKKEDVLPKEELIKKAKKADALITLLSDKIDKEVIDELDNCKIIANYAVGYNNIDTQYAGGKGIVVTNTPDILTAATADIAVTLVLSVARRLTAGEELMRNNQFNGWRPQLLLGVELRNKVVGIIGAGRIGQATAERLKSFGTKIVYYSRTRKIDFEKKVDAKKVSLNKLLSTADILSLHVPLNDKTFHLLNKDNLKLLKRTAIVINTARGEVVEETALIKLLKTNKIFGAGFDVYEGEPEVNPELLELSNAVLLPHLGSATIEARTEMANLCADNVVNVLEGKKALTPVN